MRNAVIQAAQAQATPGPQYAHDCERCTFLGRIDEGDVWHCPNDGGGSIIVRFGDDGPEYSSFPVPIARMIAMQDEKYSKALALLDAS